MEMVVEPLIGGAIIGLGSVFLMLFSGRTAGISGIANGIMLRVGAADLGWRVAFIAGLILGPLIIRAATGSANAIPPAATMNVLITAGLLVGIGTALGKGCTSGHGICGISRLSVRSIIATVTFMVFGGLTVFLTHHVL